MTAAFGVPLSTIAVLWAGAFVGAIAAGGAGFAFALAAAAIWLHALEPLQVTTLIVACGSLLHITLVWPIRRSIERERLSPFLIGAALGIPVGVAFVSQVDPHPIKLAIGAGLCLYGAYTLLAPRLPRIEGGGRPADAAVGFLGGVLGGAAGLSGVLPTIWTQLRGWPKAVARGVYQPFILFAHLLTLSLLGVAAISGDGLKLFLLALPPLALGAWLGFALYGKLDEARFKQFLALMLIASGAALLF
jgi:uncharacterized membrane protein YfcA